MDSLVRKYLVHSFEFNLNTTSKYHQVKKAYLCRFHDAVLPDFLDFLLVQTIALMHYSLTPVKEHVLGSCATKTNPLDPLSPIPAVSTIYSACPKFISTFSKLTR